MATNNPDKYEKENMARAVLRSADISLKKSIEICNFIRKKRTQDAIKMLEDTIKEKMAVPFRRFTEGAGHKKGAGAGKYPKRAASAFISIIRSAEANAQNKGLSLSELFISHICANKASTQWHHGRKRRRKMKRTHIEIYVKEGDKKRQQKSVGRIKKEGNSKEPEKAKKEKLESNVKKADKQEVVKKKK